jgi:type II secretory pathway pseudopilin PulG
MKRASSIERHELRRQARRQAEQGYILLTLLLIVSLLMIGMAVAAQSLAFQIKRDREEELVHRGVQYTRAVRRYVKQTGLFPVRLEDLRDQGGQRFIRKLYKDPITGKDFKIVYESDVRAPASPTLNPASAQSPAGFGGNLFGQPGTGTMQPTAIPNGGVQSAAGQSASTDPGANTNSTSSASANSNASGSSNSDGSPMPRTGLILGVVSTSEDKTIREFNHKNHYNEWMFFYYLNADPGADIKGPTPFTHPISPLGDGSPQTQSANPPSSTP